MPDGSRDGTAAFTVRGLSDVDRERLKRLAAEEGVSLNRYVVGILSREAARETQWEGLLAAHRVAGASSGETEAAVRMLDAIRDESGWTR